MASPTPARPERTPDRTESGYAKSRDTRARILQAALEEAEASGFHKTSVARIAARAGVAVGSVNYHFGSRSELIRELMEQLMSGFFEQVESAEAQRGLDYFARGRTVLLDYVAHVRSHPSFVRLADEIKLHEPELYRSGEERWLERIARRIRTGIAEGTLRAMSELEIQLKAKLLLGARHALEDLALRETELEGEQIVDAYLALERVGLGARGGKGCEDGPRPE